MKGVSTVISGEAWEADLMLALEQWGLEVRPSQRAERILAKRGTRNSLIDARAQEVMEGLAFTAAGKIKKKEDPLGAVGASGAKGFDDLRIYREDDSYFVLSAKNNSKEIYGPRLQTRNPANLPIRGMQDASYGDEILRIQEMIQPVVGLNWRDVDPSLKTDAYNAACNAFQRYLKRTDAPPLEIFKQVVGGVDYYMATRDNGHGTVCGYNLYGGLRCRKMASPTKIVYVDGSTSGHVTVHFNDGWVLDWRIHNRDSKIKLGGLGYTVSIIGSPDARYREGFTYGG